MIYSPWFIELALESLGCALYFRTNKILCSLLAFLAASDIITAIMLNTWPSVYAWAYWTQRFGKYFILILLACCLCGMLVDERDKISKLSATAIIIMGSAALTTVVFCMGYSLKDSLLGAEIAVNMVLAAITIVAWVGRRGILSAEQKTIMLGFIVLIASDLLCTLLWMKWHGARHFYPLGMIPAYAIWVAGPLRTVRLGELRVSLEKRFPVAEEITIV